MIQLFIVSKLAHRESCRASVHALQMYQIDGLVSARHETSTATNRVVREGIINRKRLKLYKSLMWGRAGVLTSITRHT